MPTSNKPFLSHWVEATTTVKDIIKALSTEFTSPDSHKWDLKHPTKANEIKDLAILETTTSFDKKFYLKIEREEGALNHIYLAIGTELNAEGNDFADKKHCSKVRFAWYKNNPDLFMGDWLPVQFWTSFDNDSINLIVQGDPSIDQAPYNNYLISYAYIGSLDSFAGADADTDYNFGITASCEEPPKFSNEFGNNTGTGLTDICMVGTRTGVPYQSHEVEFNTDFTFRDKNFITSSQWTHKYHASEVVVSHRYDRQRGKLKNMLILDRSAIMHLDELIENKGTEDQKVYIMFNLNAPYSFLNNAPNVLYGVAIRKS